MAYNSNLNKSSKKNISSKTEKITGKLSNFNKTDKSSSKPQTARDIKIDGEIRSIDTLNLKDVSSKSIKRTFGKKGDHIEIHIFDESNNLIEQALSEVKPSFGIVIYDIESNDSLEDSLDSISKIQYDRKRIKIVYNVCVIKNVNHH